jgi:hypothetical protein
MKDMLGRELAVGDFVAYYSNLYEVKAIGTNRARVSDHGYVKIMIYPASKTSKPVEKYSRDMVRVPREDVMMHLLREGRL